MTTFSPSRIGCPASSVSRVAVRAEVRERREHAQRLLDRARDQRRDPRAAAGADRAARAARASRCSRSPSCCRCRRPSAGRSPSRSPARRASLPRPRRGRARWSDRRSAARDARRSAAGSARRSRGCSSSSSVSTPCGLMSGSATASVAFISLAQIGVVLGRDPHEAPDHARDDRLRDLGDQVALRRGPSRRSSTLDHDRPDRGFVGGDPLRREAGLEQHLEAVVAGRIHPDEHRADQLEREHADRRDARRARRSTSASRG